MAKRITGFKAWVNIEVEVNDGEEHFDLDWVGEIGPRTKSLPELIDALTAAGVANRYSDDTLEITQNCVAYMDEDGYTLDPEIVLMEIE